MLSRFYEFVSSGGLITVPPSVEPPAEPSVDAPGDRTSPGETDLLLPTEEPEAKALLDFPFPDELPSTPSNDLPAPCPGSFSDGELMQMLGFDDGTSLPGITEFDLDPLGEEPADTAARAMKSIESLIDDLGATIWYCVQRQGHCRAPGRCRKPGPGPSLAEMGAMCVANCPDCEDSISALITALGLLPVGSGRQPPSAAWDPAGRSHPQHLPDDDKEMQFGAATRSEIGDAAIPL